MAYPTVVVPLLGRGPRAGQSYHSKRSHPQLLPLYVPVPESAVPIQGPHALARCPLSLSSPVQCSLSLVGCPCQLSFSPCPESVRCSCSVSDALVWLSLCGPCYPCPCACPGPLSNVRCPLSAVLVRCLLFLSGICCPCPVVRAADTGHRTGTLDRDRDRGHRTGTGTADTGYRIIPDLSGCPCPESAVSALSSGVFSGCPCAMPAILVLCPGPLSNVGVCPQRPQV